MDNRQKQEKYLDYFKEDGAILELGSGGGDFLSICSERGREVTGVDIVKPPISGKFKFFYGTIEKFLGSYRGKKFSGIYMRHVVEHFWPDELGKLLKKCSSVLSDNGRLVVIFPNTANINVMLRDFWSDETHKRPYTAQSLSNIAVKSGFNPVSAGPDMDSFGGGVLRALIRQTRKMITGLPQEPPDYYAVFAKKGKNDA